jgi:integrase
VQKGISGNKGLGVHALNRAVTIIRGLFKYAYEADLLDKPMKYGTGFGKPSATLRRKARQSAELENGKRLFEPTHIVSLLNSASVPLRAMILLGINGGMGNSDCARLPVAAVDFERGIIEFNRPKTGIERVVPLWPESIEALQKALSNRPKPASKEASKLVFLTAFGRPWVRDNVHRTEHNGFEKVVPVDSIGRAFGKLMRQIGLTRKGIGFYTLRHTFRTWADEIRDAHAIFRIMGHAIPGMNGLYVEKIELDRLLAVVEHVRAKLFEDSA